MREDDFEQVARFIADTVIQNRTVRDEVAEFRRGFQSMGYCLSTKESLQLAPAIFESVFPDSGFFQAFAAALRNLG
jgi:hypothetical protein